MQPKTTEAPKRFPAPPAADQAYLAKLTARWAPLVAEWAQMCREGKI